MHVLHVVRHRVKKADISFQISYQTYPVMRCIDDSQYLAISYIVNGLQKNHFIEKTLVRKKVPLPTY